MRVGRRLRVTIATTAAVVHAAPAAALDGASRFPIGHGHPAEAFAPRPVGAVATYAVSRQMDVYLGLKPPKRRSAGERLVRSPDPHAGRPQPPRALKVGVLIRW